MAAIVLVALNPFETAGVVRAAALLRGRLGRGTQLGHEQVVCERRDLHCRCYPARKVSFERALVNVTAVDRLAADFAHHISVVGEEDAQTGNDFFDADLPIIRFACLLHVSNRCPWQHH